MTLDKNQQETPLKRGKPYKETNKVWDSIKSYARGRLIKYPSIGLHFIRIWRKSKVMLLKLRWHLVSLKGTINGTYCKNIEQDKLYWINPHSIEYISKQAFPVTQFKGHIISGNWDVVKEKFNDLDVYKAFEQVFIDGNDWADTVFYKRILERLNNKEVLWACKNKQDFDKRCKYLEHLFNTIKNNGYKSQESLKVEQKDEFDADNVKLFNVWENIYSDNEVSVSIGRRGDFLFCDGAHRLVIAKLLNIPKIPIRIVVRHPAWMKFRKELELYAEEIGGKTYQPALHEDLEYVVFDHECEDRLKVVVDNLTIGHKGKVLDVGANLGYFCHKLEDIGFDCYAVEDSQINLHFLKTIKLAAHKKFKIISESVLSSKEVSNNKFEVVLALNIFHHFLKTKETYDAFLNLLRNLKTKEMFFESHLFDESQMKGAYKNYSPDEFVKLIQEYTGLKNIKFLTKAKDGRSLYKLY